MKIASYTRNGRTSFGIVTPDGIVDAPIATGRHDLALTEVLQNPAVLSDLSATAPTFAMDDVTLLPVVPDPGKIICVGINYMSHIQETGREIPRYPMLFVRWPSSQVGAEQAMICPAESESFDFEGELAVIIGRGGRRIPEQHALDFVAGYSCYNDGSIRDWQRHTSQFTPGKNFPSTGASGPWMVTVDEFGPVGPQVLTTRLNGEVVQQAPLSDMVFTIASLVSYCSSFTELCPGDIILTGTPGGVGAFREPQLWMREGDVVEVEIDGIGVLRNPVREEI